ncbi:Thioredoxin-like superfamily [Sesbania bispinosa]|nr:Thioredoxin-like superfamily [Sesbania bispinosa]
MGCVSSKHIKKELNHEQLTLTNGGVGYVNHVVSLTSTTYGALRLDNDQSIVPESKSKPPSPSREEPEVINAWELMDGLEEGVPISNQPKKSPKSTPFLRGFKASDTRSPLKFLNQFGSPKTLKKSIGKENKVQVNGVRGGVRRLDYSPKGILKATNSSPKNSGFLLKGSSPVCVRRNSFGSDTKKSPTPTPSPLFDPELVASYEKELSEEEEQIKRMVWATPKTRRARTSLDSHTLVQMFENKCPPGGENCVVIYTTTLRGIRKTFEDCNKVRSIIESYCVHTRERDVSMDSGFKEELRKLMDTKQVKVPVVFVKGRLVGGADEIVKLEEEGKLSVLLQGIPKALVGGCEGCAGVRFVMCKECNGSCKILDEEHKKTVRCGECNENGIIQCPICR